ncbi:MAG: hypothetical protein C0606_13245 [Hyphomicrobiales bacterium]|nr:MAG: hypothetical protein C0606_13245 [Hyphomicrobiales bacterium]
MLEGAFRVGLVRKLSKGIRCYPVFPAGDPFTTEIAVEDGNGAALAGGAVSFLGVFLQCGGFLITDFFQR